MKLWQAVSLSIGREPTEALREAIFKGRVTDDRAPAHVVELLKRWHYCEQALSYDGPIKPQGYGLANPPVCPVLLSEVADFLRGAGFELPEEMRALEPAQSPTSAALASGAATPTQTGESVSHSPETATAVTLAEAWGLFVFLRRVAGGIAYVG